MYNKFNINFLALLLAGFSFFVSSCSKKNSNPSQLTELKGDWKFRQVKNNEWMPAKVPGTVHGDLLANKKIEDPYYRDNEKRIQWVEKEDWEYKTTFNVEGAQLDNENVDIIFQGLDTYADIYLNDSLISKTDNMFVTYEFPIKKFLKNGNNDLRIYFHSPVNVGMEKLKKNGYLVPAVNEYADTSQRTSVFTRKAPFHYGWDWGPRIVTSGVWRPIFLKSWNTSKIDGLFVEQKKVDTSLATYSAHVDLTATKAADLTVEVFVDEKPAGKKDVSVTSGKNKVSLDFEIKSPKLWWSKGLGEQPMYKITTRLSSKANVLDTISKSIGVRTIEIVRDADSIGKSFYVKLNGVPVFMKGTNYIPSDNLIPNITPERYQKVIKAATDAHMNMIRVWGGAVYESDYFYDLCDKNGLLVWQDFMFACSMVPGDTSHLKNIKSEFDDNIKRIRNHPSIALYCGNNENMVAWYGWGLKKMFKLNDQDSTEVLETYKKVFYDILPKSIKENDPHAFYWPTSPGAEYEFDKGANNKSGDVHDWSIWFGKASFKDMIKEPKRFVSEYGLQSFPSMKTIKAFSIEEDWNYKSELFQYKQRSMMPWISKGFNGNDMIMEYVKMYYKLPAVYSGQDFEKFVYLSQLAQGEGLKQIVEGHRKFMPVCMGSLYWQLDDCWPTVSWSTMDYYYRWKAGHYMIRKAYEEIIAVPLVENGKVNIYVVSDRLKDASMTLNYRVLDMTGKEISKNQLPITVSKNASKIYFAEQEKTLSQGRPKDVYVEVFLTENGKRLGDNILYFAAPKDLNLLKPTIQQTITKSDKGYEIELSSNVLAKNVSLSSEGTEGFFSNNYMDIIPGSPVKITYTGEGNLSSIEKDLKVMSLKDTY
ncbi:MAG TPA: glycoside hydrolase family 2 protein [Cytophagaceae bacterium]|jgi:beta-mannosidase